MMAAEVFFGEVEMEEANLAFQILKSVMKVRTHALSNRYSLGWFQGAFTVGVKASSCKLQGIRGAVGSR